ncbi:MAG: leucyl aminopeptidase [Armatimonadota bacterium]|nr:leucyl aminopeptidase [Armatimonadota bacterium]MDR7451165.1 leucyl aminopeptidase [Armatimonadota bacterium]MDR7467230.1 leucyl aminopeptidase [Armatimonadota bacterium]MDR7494842.1 leucyl aminopeptidase [Armatimonadota bacterium]MDR7500265.1 leucyl aminopeptidase [Armatimonadota bacterium]
MEFAVSTEGPESIACDALAVPVHADGRKIVGAAAGVDRALGGLLSGVLQEEQFEARPGRTLVLHTHGRIPAKRVLAVGLGAAERVTLEVIRKAAAAVIRTAAAARAAHVAFPPATAPSAPLEGVAQASVEGALLGAYRFDKYKKEDAGRVERVTLLASDEGQRHHLEEGRRRGALFAEATIFARDLVNEPPNHLPPPRLAEIAADVARQAGLRCAVLDEDAMRAQGMGALLAIGAGSDQPPRLIVLEYAPPRARRAVALVGKGVCYDSGGVNLKRDDLEWMKSDMAGGAAVIATMKALPALRPKVRVLGIVAAVENMPSGRSVKPGDIVRAMNGKTIEINNTDAEGRVILADALSYAAAGDVDEIIDLATLTGSAIVALGYHAAALMSNDDALAARLLQAAEAAGERLWRLPLYEEFLEEMRSPIADLRNSAGRYGGAQKGAIFLREFTGGRPWAHLDIAPTAFLEKEEGTGPYLPKGGTGYGVRTLLTYLSGVA